MPEIQMPKIDGNVLVVGAAISFMSSVIVFQAFLSTAVGDDAVAMVSAIVFAAGIPAVAYCVGMMLARGGFFTRAFLFGSLQVFHGFAFLFLCSTGFQASLSYSMLLAGVIFLGHLADGPDDRFYVVRPVMLCLSTSFTRTVGSDFASGMCFLSVFIFATLLRFFYLTEARPGSLHAYFAGLYSLAPPAQQPAAPLGRSYLTVITAVKTEGIADEIVVTTVKAEESADNFALSVR